MDDEVGLEGSGRLDGLQNRDNSGRLEPDLIEAGDACARAILEKHRSDLEAGVALLIAEETLTAEEFAPLRPAVAHEQAAE